MHPLTGSSPHVGLRVAVALFSIALCLLPGPAGASDHADPIDLFRSQRLEPGLTDLFVFPIDSSGVPVAPNERTDGLSLSHPSLEPRPELSEEQQAQIDALIVILCFRRQLPNAASLDLEPYTYRINMDLERTVDFDDDQTRLRYGGSVVWPDEIAPTATIELRFSGESGDDALKVTPTYSGALTETDQIEVWSGIRDDPFIFPMFFGNNVVAVVFRIPITSFPADQRDWIVWATSSKGDRQIDQVGRSLRTQNPRFELLNPIPPSEHVPAIAREHEHPSLMRDLFLRINVQSLFAFRAWDNVPDVMIYSRRFPVGFPNGRLLTDDVAAMLAQFGDTLLYELSYLNGGWPRQTTNDKPFQAAFPYLAEPWAEPRLTTPSNLSTRNQVILGASGVAVAVLVLLGFWKLVQIIRSGFAPKRPSRVL